MRCRRIETVCLRCSFVSGGMPSDASVSSREGDLSSTTTSGIPLMKITMSGRLVS